MPSSPGTTLWVGPDGGPFTVVGSANALPVTANAGTGSFTVVGAAAAGAAPSGAPVYAAGFDGTNIQGLKTDTTGHVLPGPNSSTGLLKATAKGMVATAQTIKTSAGTLYTMIVTNNSATVQFAQVYDTAAGSVTAGTTAVVLQVAVPPNTTVVVNLPQGMPFATAIAATATTTMDGATGAGANTIDAYFIYQ